MILDASVVVEILLRTAIGRMVLEWAARDADVMHAPHHLDVEVMHALRRLARNHELSAEDATFAVETLPLLRIERHAHLLLLPRIWELRESVTAHDAAYVALAEALDAPLLTCDARLSRAHGHRARIELLS